MKKQLTLGDLIKKLEKTVDKEDKDKGVYFDFCHTVPVATSSYRGHYDQLAIEWEKGGYKNPLNLIAFIELLKDTNGRVFDGYKGGQFKMSLDTPVWVANWGRVGDTAIVKVKDFEWCTILKTAQIRS